MNLVSQKPINPVKRLLLRKKRRKEGWFKYIMSVSHLWLGLLSCMVVFVVCLSGSIYAFRQQIENIVNHRGVYVTPKNAPRAIIDNLLNDFERNYGPATSVTLHSEQNKSVIISSFSRNNPGVTAYYDPYTGKRLSTQNRSCTAFFDFVLDLHRFLLAGEMGKLINGIAVLIFVFMLFSGFVLWMPKKLKLLKKSLTISWNERFYRLNYDLHRVLGFYSLLLLFFIALTGLYVSFHWVKNIMIIGLGGDSIVISENNLALKRNLADSFSDLLNNLTEEGKNPTATTRTLQSLVTQANENFRNEGTIIIRLPNEQLKTVRITKMNNNNFLHFYVPDVVGFSPSGQVQDITPFNTLPLNEQFKAIARPLHTGEIMGLPSIIIYAIASLIGCSLPVTGFIIWWKKLKTNVL